jgi:hypothetical protein
LQGWEVDGLFNRGLIGIGGTGLMLTSAGDIFTMDRPLLKR